MATLIGNSPSQTNDALASLASEGLAFYEVVGRAHVWRLSDGHVLVAPLKRLFEDEAGLPRVLEEHIQKALKGLPIERALLFGSVARGEEQPFSDIDLFVQVPTEAARVVVAEALGKASQHFAERFGNTLSNLVLTRAHLSRRHNPDLMATIEREGIPVAG
jgi:predicted nucleotidyltransferase